MFDYTAALERNVLYSRQLYSSSPLDRYALGFCIANCSSITSWKVHMEYGSAESFMWGLNSNHSGNGVISRLTMLNVSPTCLESYPPNILRGIQDLLTNAADVMLEQVLPKMKNLTSLQLHNFRRPTLLDAISQTNVTTLNLHVMILLSDRDFQSSLRGLVNSPSKKLKDLTIECFVSSSIKPLCDILFRPSSLNHLTLRSYKLLYFADDSFDLLETNTCLTTLHVYTIQQTHPLQPLTKILLNNKTIENLHWGCSSEWKDENLFTKQVDSLNTALSSNTTLKKLTLVMHVSRRRSVSLSKLECDSRVKLSFS